MSKQPLYIDFYNLHLTSGYASGYNDATEAEIQYPDPEEKNKLIDFFSEHEPSITSTISAEDYLKPLDAKYSEVLGSLGWYELERIRPMFSSIDSDYLGYTSHETHELNKYFESKSGVRRENLDDLISQFYDSFDAEDARRRDHEFEKYLESEFEKALRYIDRHPEELISWFDSGDFLEFTKEYYFVRRVIDDYINGRVCMAALAGLEKRIKKFDFRFKINNKSTNDETPIYTRYTSFYVPSDHVAYLEEDYLRTGGGFYLDIGSVELGWSTHHDAQTAAYGISLDMLMFRVYQGLVNILQEKQKPEIRYCSYEFGKRTPFCDNIFIPDKRNKKKHKFCSTNCRLRYHNNVRDPKEHREYMKEKRRTDPKYRWWGTVETS